MIRVVALADKKGDELLEAARDFTARAIRRYAVELTLLKPGKRAPGADDERVREEEGERLLAASQGMVRIALDAGGRALETRAFAAALEKRLAQGRGVAFLVGGATGLARAVLDTADEVWSLSPLTFAHRLAVLVVCEQIYRAGEISRGGPYAK